LRPCKDKTPAGKTVVVVLAAADEEVKVDVVVLAAADAEVKVDVVVLAARADNSDVAAKAARAVAAADEEAQVVPAAEAEVAAEIAAGAVLDKQPNRLPDTRGEFD
jgi:hypothetical protein